MNFHGALFAGILLATTLRAELTPLDTAIPEQKETLVECELKQRPTFIEPTVFASQQVAESAKGTYHYKLWLPKGYHAQPQHSWPCIFIASPGGNAGFATMGECLSRNYVVVMLVESRNDRIPMSIGNFLAAHDDVIRRVRVEEGQKLATGYSGGARLSSVFVQLRPGFCGLILQGAGSSVMGFWVPGHNNNTELWVAMTMGDADRNNAEVNYLKRFIGTGHFEVFPFKGEHVWAPTEVFTQALDWVKQQTHIDTP